MRVIWTLIGTIFALILATAAWADCGCGKKHDTCKPDCGCEAKHESCGCTKQRKCGAAVQLLPPAPQECGGLPGEECCGRAQYTICCGGEDFKMLCVKPECEKPKVNKCGCNECDNCAHKTCGCRKCPPRRAKDAVIE